MKMASSCAVASGFPLVKVCGEQIGDGVRGVAALAGAVLMASPRCRAAWVVVSAAASRMRSLV
ncbi:hypothetical protein [Actinomadura opuntiae]|uniref:hypothetical protein n=1 Tax=Actinomadura sp. OS1-43 TaxID=604315 RepID=UPI00255B2369|nr:hypothetical protein [Actinomadura sp. OS1-43]MDL4817339.1 hypothetical protein [Actinomadura sp. OS1-43]